ncbi:MAG: NUDIX hydrolase [Planctomycetes bacterium]|nr:NUDIX hydrolase [Planctomycetota bacterium]
MANPWRYDGPKVTVDSLIVRDDRLLLIERRFPPPGWALPGGFVDKDETVEQAVCRETLEETGLVVTRLRQLHCYSDPRRDPRQHTAGVVFEVETRGEPTAGDDAGACRWFRFDRLPPLAFDHDAIVADFRARRYPGGAFENAPESRSS